MIITGYRYNVKTTDAVRSIHKHIEPSLHKSKKMIDEALEGKVISLPNDFVLREDLEDAG